MKFKRSGLEEKTKIIYNEQHKAYAKSSELYNRFLKAALTAGFFGIPDGYLENKSVLDAGCGTTGYITDAMCQLGAGRITHLDIGDSWISDLRNNLEQHNIKGDFQFVPGSTTKLPFDNSSFDFVMSNGVIMHLKSKREANKAVKELIRVTKPGGYLYVYVGVSEPGVMDRFIYPSLRRAYKQDKDFKKYIDELSEEELQREIREIYSLGLDKDPLINKNSIEFIASLFNIDSVTFFQNALQVPRQQSAKLDQTFIRRALQKQGINDFRRIDEIYWERNDFRRFLTPLHLAHTSKISKIMYGGGHLKIVCQKPMD